VVLVAVALVVSFAGDDDDQVVTEEPADVAVFCLAAEPFDSFDRLDLDAGAAGDLRELQVAADGMAAQSPDPIAQDLAAVNDALQNVIEVVEGLSPDDPEALAKVTEAFDVELGAVDEQADEAAAYIRRWCGATLVDEPGSDATSAPG
jgi:hypothetical protein